MNNTSKQLQVISAPFVKNSLSFQRILLDKLFAIVALFLSSIYFWGVPALVMSAVAVITALCVEAIAWKLMGLPQRISDGNAVIIGLSFAMLLPAGSPLWIVALGTAFCIIFGKMIFGGIAYTPFPPVAVGYAMISAAWSQYLSPTEVIVATELLDPLAELKSYGVDSLSFTFTDFITGNQLTVLGGASLGVILCVLAFMLIRKILRYEVVLGYVLGISALSYVYYMQDPSMNASPLFFLSTGTVLLSLMLMLSDYSSIPTMPIPRFLYGFAVGCMLVLIRIYTSNFDGAPLGILLASFLVPYLDMIRSKPFGVRR